MVPRRSKIFSSFHHYNDVETLLRCAENKLQVRDLVFHNLETSPKVPLQLMVCSWPLFCFFAWAKKHMSFVVEEYAILIEDSTSISCWTTKVQLLMPLSHLPLKVASWSWGISLPRMFLGFWPGRNHGSVKLFRSWRFLGQADESFSFNCPR